MIWLKRSFGLLACVLGTAGIVVCLAACVMIWITRARVDRAVTSIFDRVDAAIVRVDQRSAETIQHIDDTRNSADQMRQRVRSRVVQAVGAKAADALDLDQLQQQLATKVQRAKDWTEFIRSTIDLVEQLLGIVDSAALVERRTQTREELAAAIQAGYQEIEQASELLDEMREHVVKIREGTDVPQNSGRVQEILDRIDVALVDLQQHVTQFQVGLEKVQDDTADLATRVHGWILVAAVILTALFAWLGIAQFSLAVHSWKFFRRQA